MKICLIVYSNTGNTMSVSKSLETELKKNHEVEIKEVLGKRSKDITLTASPKIDAYDYIIFASFVEAFQLNQVMKKYLKEINSLKGKKVSAFVTEAFSKPWLGGNTAIKQIKKICADKDCTLEKTGIINWNNKNRENQIKDLIENFSNIK